jgi:hypothetical protein
VQDEVEVAVVLEQQVLVQEVPQVELVHTYLQLG